MADYAIFNATRTNPSLQWEDVAGKSTLHLLHLDSDGVACDTPIHVSMRQLEDARGEPVDPPRWELFHGISDFPATRVAVAESLLWAQTLGKALYLFYASWR